MIGYVITEKGDEMSDYVSTDKVFNGAADTQCKGMLDMLLDTDGKIAASHAAGVALNIGNKMTDYVITERVYPSRYANEADGSKEFNGAIDAQCKRVLDMLLALNGKITASQIHAAGVALNAGEVIRRLRVAGLALYCREAKSDNGNKFGVYVMNVTDTIKIAEWLSTNERAASSKHGPSNAVIN